MALDGLFLRLLSEELKELLIGAKVDKIYQTQKTELIFSLRTRSGAYRLLISASGNAPRIHLTTHQIENPANPPMLCMLLRKQLGGATLISVEQAGLDRILKLNFSAVNELGDRVIRTLVVEIMAQYSNIILIDDNGKIIDSVKRVDETKSSVRQVLPGLEYITPPQRGKLDLFAASTHEIISAIKAKGTTIQNAILNTMEGMSPVLCREIAYRVGALDLDTAEISVQTENKLRFELEGLKTTAANRAISPQSVANSDGKLLDFSFIPITQYGSTAIYKSYESLSELLEDFYYERERLVRTKSKAEDLFKTVSSLIDRTAKKINNQRIELEACKDREEKRILAELINANLYQLKKGAAVYEVLNYYTGEMVKIPVKPELSPTENAQRYFKEYKKLKTAEEMLTVQIEKGKAEIEYLATVSDALERCETEREISEIRKELSDAGFIKATKNAKYKTQKPLPPIEYTSPNGFKVLVGRNNEQNDRLSLKTAAKSDMWFHIQKAPGSHVVLVLEGTEPKEEDMEFAARAAAFHSSGRQAGAVEVDYTKASNLKKPTGAKPGFVIYHVYSSVLVKPSEFKP